MVSFGCASRFETVGAAIRAIDVPHVPIPGNHDWHDGDAAYRAYFGPPMYRPTPAATTLRCSMTQRLAVLNDAASLDERLDIFDTDLGLIDRARCVVVMMHAPPPTGLTIVLMHQAATRAIRIEAPMLYRFSDLLNIIDRVFIVTTPFVDEL